MAFKNSQQEFSSPQGYLLPEVTQRGIRDGTNVPAGYKDAAKAMEDVTSDLLTSGNVNNANLTNPEPNFPMAKFATRGAVKTDSGFDLLNLDPRIQAVNQGRRRMRYWINSIGSFTGLNEFGVTPGSSGVTTWADASDADGSASSAATDGTSGNFFYFNGALSGAQIGQRRHALYHYCKFKLASVADIRFWMGMFDTQPTGSDTPAAANGVGIRFSTASDTTFKLCGLAAGSVTTVDTLVTPAANTLYEIEWWSDASLIGCKINASQVFSLASGLPTSTTSLAAYSAFVSLTALAAAVKTMSHYNSFYSQS